MSSHGSKHSSEKGSEHSSHHSQAEKVSVNSRDEEEEAIAPAPGVDIRLSPKEHHGSTVLFMFTACSFISFALMLTAACPVAWLRASNGDIWTLWKDNNKERWQKNACAHQKQMYISMEAYTIVSVVLCLAAFVAGLVQMTGSGHMGMTLSLGVLAMSTTLVSWALIVHQYHKFNCPGVIPGVHGVSRLGAGFALSMCSFGLMFFANIALAYYFGMYFAKAEDTKDDHNSGAFASFALLACTLVIATVGTAFTMWETYYAEATVKITFWHVEIFHRSSGLSEFWGIGDYNCKQLSNYFKAGLAFSIIGDAFVYVAMLLALAAVYKKAMKMAAVGATIAAWVFLLISWAIMIGARYKKFCKNGSTDYPAGLGLGVPLATGVEQHVDFAGYVITEGLGMIISSFCACIVVMILLLVKA